MKYKNIHSAIHNLGDSFVSLMNYVDDGYVIDDLAKIHSKGYDIEINWKDGTFKPVEVVTPRIEKSIQFYLDNMLKHFSSQNVEYERLKKLTFIWPSRNRKYMYAECDKGKEYKIYVQEYK